MVLNFNNLTHEEFRHHRGTCPLEIGRFQGVRNNVEEIIGPLHIYRIWTQNDKIDEINVSLHQKEIEEFKLYGPIKIILGSDKKLYTKKGEIYYSITRIEEK